MVDFMAFMTKALGLTVALTWSNATTHILEYIFPPVDGKAAVRYAIAYAILTTVVVILVIMIINYFRKRRYTHDEVTAHGNIIPALELWQPPCSKQHCPAPCPAPARV